MKAYLLLYFNCLWESLKKSVDKQSLISVLMEYMKIID